MDRHYKEKEGAQRKATHREGRDNCLDQDWQLTGKKGAIV
jgi:hypothetical protein